MDVDAVGEPRKSIAVRDRLVDDDDPPTRRHRQAGSMASTERGSDPHWFGMKVRNPWFGRRHHPDDRRFRTGGLGTRRSHHSTVATPRGEVHVCDFEPPSSPLATLGS